MTSSGAALPGVLSAERMTLVGHNDLAGMGDCMHVNVVDGYAYIGHMGTTPIGTSIVDVRDPENPTLVHQISRPQGTHSHKVQVVGDLLLVNHEKNRFEEKSPERWSAGLAIYDVSRPAKPRQIGFFETPGVGTHRMTYWDPPYAYVSATDDGYDGRILRIVDLSDPTKPVEVGRWWYPGQHVAAGEQPGWRTVTDDVRGPRPREVGLHHVLPYGDDRVYGGWWDGGLVCLDVSDKGRPFALSVLDLGAGSANTHTAQRLPGRELLVVTDEQLTKWIGVQRDVRVVDVSNESDPRVLSHFPVPSPSLLDEGVRFGPHNLHEMRPGSFVDGDLVYVTYFAGGLRAVDVSDPMRPVEVAHVVPEAPVGRETVQINDVTVTADGVLFLTERHAGGLYIAVHER